MSFVSPDAGITVGGVSASVSAGPPVGVAGADAGDVLAFTGAGPGTFYLAIIGFATLITGALMTLFGRRRREEKVQAPVNGLADLSPLAAEVGRRRSPAAIAWINQELAPIRWTAQH